MPARLELTELLLVSSTSRIFSVLSAILHLGNIRYKRKTYRDDAIDICNPEELPVVSELLEVWKECVDGVTLQIRAEKANKGSFPILKIIPTLTLDLTLNYFN